MSMFIQYSIKDTDTFDERIYPQVVTEIDGLHESLRGITSAHKASIVISLLKDHSIRKDWLDSNKQLAKMLMSGFLQTSSLESLFDSCKQNRKFLTGLEAYINRKFA